MAYPYRITAAQACVSFLSSMAGCGSPVIFTETSPSPPPVLTTTAKTPFQAEPPTAIRPAHSTSVPSPPEHRIDIRVVDGGRGEVRLVEE